VSVSRTVFELFDSDLEIWVRGHSKSFKLVPLKAWVRFPIRLLYGSIMHQFRDKARY